MSLSSTRGSTALPPGQLGLVTSVRGSEVRVDLPSTIGADRPRATVGKFVGIRTDISYLVGTITDVSARSSAPDGSPAGTQARLDLLGEIRPEAGRPLRFQRGITDYPAIGDAVELIGSEELRLVYRGSGGDHITVGTLHQDRDIPARVDVNDLVSKHFAVLGTTGVGKSSGVAVILQQILDVRPDLRVFLLDSHSEYGRCFGDKAHVVGPRTLKLPFWLFNFDEIVDVVFGGRTATAEELEILAELIPIAKASYGQYKAAAERNPLRRTDGKNSGFTVDTPVPYVLQDLVALIDDRMGRLENRAGRMHYHRLMARIEAIRNDPRYGFMFANANVGGDTMGELLTQLFRLEDDGRPMCVMQLAGLPAEVLDAVVCVLCRLAFEFGLWSEGVAPLLFVCEEAHRFASADPALGFHPTRRALSRIAKEGRKYGVFLGLVTQRPAELDPTILSQCSTLFAMRLSNERDQAILRSAVSDAGANLLPFVSSLGTRDVIGFGEGIPLSARMVFADLPADRLPRRELAEIGDDEPPTHRDLVRGVIDRWRGATMGGRAKPEEGPPDAVGPDVNPAPAARSTVDQARFRILKRPLGEVAQVLPREFNHR